MQKETNSMKWALVDVGCDVCPPNLIGVFTSVDVADSLADQYTGDDSLFCRQRGPHTYAVFKIESVNEIHPNYSPFAGKTPHSQIYLFNKHHREALRAYRAPTHWLVGPAAYQFLHFSATSTTSTTSTTMDSFMGLDIKVDVHCAPTRVALMEFSYTISTFTIDQQQKETNNV